MTAATSTRAKIASFFGSAGEAIHFVVGTSIAYASGGIGLAGVYLILTALPSIFRAKLPRWMGWLAPIAFFGLAVGSPKPATFLLLLLGLGVGVGNAALGRTPAFTSGLWGPPGQGAWAGAAAAAFLTASGLESIGLMIATVLALIGIFGGEEYAHRGPLPSALYPAAAAGGFIVGMRTLELIYGGGRPPTQAIFALAWLVGAHFGWRVAANADPRAVLAAPFIGAMALAGMGAIRGPGLVFLYVAVAGSIALVAGTARSEHGLNSRGPLVLVAFLGVFWVSGPWRLDTMLWGASGVLLAGSFISSFVARRAVPAEVEVTAEAEPSVVIEEAPEPAPIPVTVPEQPLDVDEDHEVDPQVEAAKLLLLAMREARDIRAEGLRELRSAIRMVKNPPAFEQVALVLEEFQTNLRETHSQIAEFERTDS